MFTDNKNGPAAPQIKTPEVKDLAIDGVKSLVEEKTNFKGKNEILTAGTAITGVAGKVGQEKVTVDKPLWTQQPTSKIYNAKTIAENQILGINRVVKMKVVIEGKVINHFKHFKLNQSASKHHSFDLILAAEEIGDQENHDMESAQNFLGKRLTVVFLYKDVDDSPERAFVGVITEVGFEQDQGSLGNIVLSGFDPTILLDAAPHTQSFGGAQALSLNSIADSIVKEGLGSSKYDFRVNCSYKNNIGYTSQYNETHYNYLARIAEAYGEQFFYDGEVLHFGELPPQENAVELEYGSNVSDIKVKMRAVHVNPTYYGYNSSKDEKLSAGKSNIKHRSDIAGRAYQISHDTFKTPSLRVAPIKSLTYKDVDASQKGNAGSSATQVFITTGNTSLPFLYPGCLADIKMRKKDSTQTSHFTKLMITEVTHEIDGRGYYNGTFQAIAADTGFLPRPEFEQPKAESQFAKVTSNTDPLNQGRVQVKFDWQMNDTTEWIRVMTPDAGGSDKVSKNRGFMSIPEVGDQVMVDFIHDNPDRPFVMGSMFHGKVGGGGGSGNNVKSLSSKSGHTVSLNDGGGITVMDKSGGNHIVVDGTNKITVTSSQTVELTNGKASITLEGDKITIYADEIEIAKSGGDSTKIDIKGLKTLISGKDEMNVKSDTKLLAESGGTTDVKATSAMTVEGAMTTVKASGITEVKGTASVNIN